MKFLLIMTMCSSIYQTCMPPVEMYPMYDTYTKCSANGHQNSLFVLKEMKPKVEADRITAHFECKQMIGA